MARFDRAISVFDLAKLFLTESTFG